MSNAIQVRDLPTRQVSLFRQQPAVVIGSDEGHDLATARRSNFNVYGSGAGGVVRLVVEAGATGLFTTHLMGPVVPVYSNYPTGGPSVIQPAEGEMVAQTEDFPMDASTWTRWLEATKILLRTPDVNTKPTLGATAKLRVECIASIQAALGLPTQAIARVLGITRQCLYIWLDGSKELNLQGANRLRLTAVERVTKLWRDRSNLPLGTVAHEPLTGGHTVLDLLTEEDLNEEAIIGAFDEIAGKLQSKPKSQSQKMAEAGFTRRGPGKSLPDDE